jgi:tetratricopeptide (TPR) repeat protein
MGRHDEAIAELKRAVELEPLNLKYNSNLGQVYRNARRYDLALEQHQKQLKSTQILPPGTAISVGHTVQWVDMTCGCRSGKGGWFSTTTKMT